MMLSTACLSCLRQHLLGFPLLEDVQLPPQLQGLGARGKCNGWLTLASNDGADCYHQINTCLHLLTYTSGRQSCRSMRSSSATQARRAAAESAMAALQRGGHRAGGEGAQKT